MENFISFIKSFISNLPRWIQIVISVLVSFLVAFLAFFSVVSCGSTVKATVSNRAEGVTTTLSVTTSNPTTVSVTPDTDVKFNPKN